MIDNWLSTNLICFDSPEISVFFQPNQINLEEQVVVCKYISNPLLVDGKSIL